VIITLGKGGILFNQGKQLRQIPAYKVNVVDTTSAGDAFVAGFSGCSEPRRIDREFCELWTSCCSPYYQSPRNTVIIAQY